MAAGLFSHRVSDLCLGKPALRSLSVAATVGDALFALRSSEDSFLSVWSCDHRSNTAVAPHEEGEGGGECRCVGKLCMVDVICYLSSEDGLSSPSEALKAPVSALLPKIPGQVVHVEPSSRLVEAIDLILQGAQNLVVPIQTRSARRKQHQKLSSSTSPVTVHKGQEFCWLTQEDVIRFLLNSIGIFSPIPALTIDTLRLISTEVLAVDYHSPASAALEAISRSHIEQTSVAVVDGEGILIGEISPSTLACCDETVAAAVATLSCGDLMAYIDCGGPPEDLVRVVKERLKERNCKGMLEEFAISSAPSNSSSMSSSSDDESFPSPNAKLARSGKYSRSHSYSARMVRRSEAIVCHPKSSLMAVMIQAIAHRVNYVWVIEDDCSLVGIVTFSSMLEVFREHLENLQ
ncbi:CBS domain-containing protein CBSX5 [Syzygium oleosum]|uniref:CBS domain-containing protein CBSX5 n=1 Tax=Syzygium oleosum TaxID=219896 RepID=UPI0024BBB917|nr:CBS domain-containing protein CBSX5 [Syzygium oleosum]